MKTIEYPDRSEWSEILKRPTFETQQLDEIVQKVIDDVRRDGDLAVRKHTAFFDKVDLSGFRVSEDEFALAEKMVDAELKAAITRSADNIRLFHQSQKQEIKKIDTAPGVECWQKSVPIEKVGLYVPGGTAPLFSTVLMLAIPAKIAGCSEIVLCSPPNKEGKLHPAILFAARLVGITKVFKIGGVQAIAAMAIGTQSVPKVYKIFGPGNQYVTAAKQLLSRNDVAIDMPAGPSEVEVLIDETCNPAFVAADLLSQAEHGADSQVLLVTTNSEIIDDINQEINRQLEKLPRKEIAQKAIAHSKFILVNDWDEAVDITNEYAPEHLIIAMKNYEDTANRIINAGSVFLGNYTPESAGDYSSGTNHTLPTNGWSKSFNGVNLDSYIKKITFQRLTEQGVQSIGNDVVIMAKTESLEAHANAMQLRLNEVLKNK